MRYKSFELKRIHISNICNNLIIVDINYKYNNS